MAVETLVEKLLHFAKKCVIVILDIITMMAMLSFISEENASVGSSASLLGKSMSLDSQSRTNITQKLRINVDVDGMIKKQKMQNWRNFFCCCARKRNKVSSVSIFSK